ncbi:hypothetical protein ACIQ4I_20480 [Rummeliibacillus sp. NPDC094406]|uniref:hypothetical protein n=1 Tax=Rummeliibacillus sp. NPDC094406 TaxID=3364511 RepID=UPI0037FA4BCC
MFTIGERVMVSRDNDNENYDSFRNKVLVVTHIATNKQEHKGYDGNLEAPLYDLELENGEAINRSLYEYELEYAD